MEGRALGSPHVSIQLDSEGERTVFIVAFGNTSMSQGGTDTFPILVTRDSKSGFVAATCCEPHGPNAHAVRVLVGVLRDLGCSGDALTSSGGFEDDVNGGGCPPMKSWKHARRNWNGCTVRTCTRS